MRLFIKKVLLITFLLSTSLNLNCSNGWSVAGFELTPSDTTNTVFIEIMDTDSVMHYYHYKIYNTSNWCYLHQEFEDIYKLSK